MTCENDLRIDFCEILNLNTLKQEESHVLLSSDFTDSEVYDNMISILFSIVVIVKIILLINLSMMIFSSFRFNTVTE